MLKLAPILEEVPEDICVSGHEGSGGHDRKLHQALPFHPEDGIGPKSITRKSEMANHNSRVKSMRMEAYFFNFRAREVANWSTTHDNGYWHLDEIANVYDVPPFKHIYVDYENGVPFFTSGELFKLERKADKFLSKSQTKDLHKYILGRAWVLLARSGQLGGIICKPQFSDSALEGTATSDHVIRIVHKSEEVPPGYIFAYLSIPELGYHLISRTASGTSIP